MFLELNYYEASKQDKFPNWLLSQHLHIALFFQGGGCHWFAGCDVEVSRGGKVYEKQSDGESLRDRTTLGEKEWPCRHTKQNKQSYF